ncbi:hypothetical protein [Halomonas sp.]|uniref:hypothetical protein n=1 Tax=Halomonas sp. TaxID=1486246 RepID=UPI00384CD3BF
MPDSPSLSLDAVGGTRVAGLQDTRWRCAHADLRSLDLADCPALITLDLRHAPNLHHLTVQDCPALEVITLPDLARVIVHLDAGREPPFLRVMGGIEHIDVSWWEGRFAADCEDLAPWQNSVIGDAAFVNRHGEEADLQIIIGEYAAEPASAANGSVRSPWLRHLLVIGCHQLQRIEVLPEAEQLETLCIDHAPVLDVVVLQRKVLQADFRNTRRLTRIEGLTDTLSIKRATQRDAGLVIRGRHRVVRLVSCGLKRLMMSHPCQLLLMRCPRLTQLGVPIATRIDYHDLLPPRLGEQDRMRIDESLLRQMRDYFIHSRAGALDELKSLMPRMAGRRQAVHALILLDQLLDEGVNPSELWALRQELMTRHLFGHLSPLTFPRPSLLAASRRLWLWNLPQDLALEGWAADYRLWLVASETDPAAQDYATTIYNACRDDPDGPAVTTVIEHVVRHRGRPCDQAIDTLYMVLKGLASAARRQHGNAEALPRALSWSTALALHLGRYGERFDRVVVNFARRTLHPHQFLTFAERAGPHHPLVHDHLMRMVNGQVRYPLPPHEAREMPSLAEHARRLLEAADRNRPLLGQGWEDAT